MRYGLVIQTAAASEPVSLDEAKDQCSVSSSDSSHDTKLTRLITAARQAIEAASGLQIITATWDMYLDQWPAQGFLELPKSPATAITSITYTDNDGATQTWTSTNYILSTSRQPARVQLAYGISWPSARYVADSIRVRFVAGYASASAVPELINSAILMLIDDWFNNRSGEGELSPAVKHILSAIGVGEEFVDYAGRCS